MDGGLRKRRGNDEESKPLLDNVDEDEEDYRYQERTSPVIQQKGFYDQCVTLMSWFWNSMWSVWPFSLQIDEPTRLAMLRLKTNVTEKFNKDDRDHMLELLNLWELGFPGQSVPYDIVSNDWKKLGFQSDDPMRDFRGTGIFGLQQILFFAELYPIKFTQILDLQNLRGEMYPFVVTSFNVTMMLFELLGWGWKKPGVSTAVNQECYFSMIKMLIPSPDCDINETKYVLNQMYSVAMVILDTQWINTGASYMDFPVVLQKTQSEFENIFLGGNKTITDINILLDSVR